MSASSSGKTIVAKNTNPKSTFLFKEIKVRIRLFCQNGQAYDICYKDYPKLPVLEYVIISDMNEADEKRFIEIMTNSLECVAHEDKSEIESGYGISSRNYYESDIIKKYNDNLYKEIGYLKHNGGHKYKVTNGVALKSSDHVFYYSFELEAELYLGEDAPISITANGFEATGTVLACEDFQLIIAIDKSIGSVINVGYISVEPWKLLKALTEKLLTITTSDDIAIKLLEAGDSAVTGVPIVCGQEKAKEKARQLPISIIWGPPGTGKTHTMAEIAIEFMKKGKTVLVVSHSNISVDGVINKIAELAEKSHENSILESGRIMRYGYVRDQGLSKRRSLVSFTYTVDKNPNVKARLDALAEEKNKYGLRSPKGIEIQKKITALHKSIRDSERQYVSNAKCVATTISKVAIDTLFDERKYDVVMFDEISMAYVPQVVLAALHTREHLICVGDFRQLAPIAQSSAKTVLEKDLFSFLGICSSTGKVQSHPWLTMLNVQRRMHPDIAAFVNNRMYDKGLKNHSGLIRNRKSIVNGKPFPGNALNLLDLRGTYCAAAKNSDNSRYNILSALISFGSAITAEENGENSTAVITPYSAQSRLVRAMILDHKKKTETNVTCSTVHQFQGSERNVLIFDAVESYPSSKAGWLMSKNDNQSVNRLINVAITRAKGKIITVANSLFWTNIFKDTANALYQFIKHNLSYGNIKSGKEKTLVTVLESYSFGKNINYYPEMKNALNRLEKDIDNAKAKIVISMPDGYMPEGDFIYSLLEKAKKKGVTILSKANNYDALPDNWKSINEKTKNACFPLLVVDDKIMWYGLPVSEGLLKAKDKKYVTICTTIFRITGEHTLEMISSLSELEFVLNEGYKRPLLPVDESGKGLTSAGFAAFVQEKKKCKCGASMKLTKSKKGKFYLKCISCGETEFVTVEFLDWYINSQNVRCPEDNGSLQAKLGPYGIYVCCSKGHYVKLDQI